MVPHVHHTSHTMVLPLFFALVYCVGTGTYMSNMHRVLLVAALTTAAIIDASQIHSREAQRARRQERQTLRKAARTVARNLSQGGWCTTDEDCNLNGVCLAGKCSCVPEWDGGEPHCGLLNLAPAKARPNGGYDELNTSSWGGSIVGSRESGDGLYHMYVRGCLFIALDEVGFESATPLICECSERASGAFGQCRRPFRQVDQTDFRHPPSTLLCSKRSRTTSTSSFVCLHCFLWVRV
jgi:hypothetical protein